mgnify:CR=1 FL=1
MKYGTPKILPGAGTSTGTAVRVPGTPNTCRVRQIHLGTSWVHCGYGMGTTPVRQNEFFFFSPQMLEFIVAFIIILSILKISSNLFPTLFTYEAWFCSL